MVFGDGMTHEEAEGVAVDVARMFLKYDSDEGRIIEALEEQGLPFVEARKLYCFVQTAFEWAFLKKLGVSQLPSVFVVHTPAGRPFTVPVASQHVFMAALGVAHRVTEGGGALEIGEGVFQAVVADGAGVNAISKVYNDGGAASDVDDFVTVFVDFTREDFGLPPKQWWQFWR